MLQNRTSLIHKLPHELLSHVFVVGLPSLATWLEQLRMPESAASTVRVYQTTMASVCPDWRTVALSTPQLWRVIIIRSGGQYEDEMLAEYVKRSGNVTVHLWITHPDTAFSDRQLSSISPLLKRAGIYGVQHRESSVSDFRNLTLESAPRLRELHIGEGLGPKASVMFCSFTAGLQPALEVLTMSAGSCRQIDIPSFPITLRTLQISELFWLSLAHDDILALLSKYCPRLEVVRLFGFSPAKLPTHFPPGLRTLHIHGSWQHAKALPFWLCSSLVHLEIYLFDINLADDATLTLQDPPPLYHLRTLSLSMSQYAGLSSPVMQLLSRAPHLRALEVNWRFLSPLLLLSHSLPECDMTPFSGSRGLPLLSNLRFLRIQFGETDFIDLGAISAAEAPSIDVSGLASPGVQIDGGLAGTGWNEPSEFTTFKAHMHAFMRHQHSLPHHERTQVEWWLNYGELDWTHNLGLDGKTATLYEWRLESIISRFTPPGGAPWYRVDDLDGWEVNDVWFEGEKVENMESLKHFAGEPVQLSSLTWTEGP